VARYALPPNRENRIVSPVIVENLRPFRNQSNRHFPQIPKRFTYLFLLFRAAAQEQKAAGASASNFPPSAPASRAI